MHCIKTHDKGKVFSLQFFALFHFIRLFYESAMGNLGLANELNDSFYILEAKFLLCPRSSAKK
jgi:hypothetical protein